MNTDPNTERETQWIRMETESCSDEESLKEINGNANLLPWVDTLSRFGEKGRGKIFWMQELFDQKTFSSLEMKEEQTKACHVHHGSH